MRDPHTTITYMHGMRPVSVQVATGSYLYQRGGKWWSFLQEWCWKFLHKTNALEEYYRQDEEYHRVEFSRDDFAKYLLRCYSQCFPYRDRPKHVYIGPREFEEFLRQPYNNLVSVGFEIEMREGNQGGYKMFSLPVTIVPHMNGVLIV